MDDRDELVGSSPAQTVGGDEEAEIAVVYLDDGQEQSPRCIDLAGCGRPLRLPAAALVEGTRLELPWQEHVLTLRLVWCHPLGVGGPWMVGAEALAAEERPDSQRT